MSTTEDFKEMNRVFVDALNRPDWAQAIKPLVSNPEEYEEIVAFHKPFRQAFPDYHSEIQEMIAEGDRLVVWVKVDATHQAEFNDGGLKGIPATGKHASWDEISIYRTHEDGTFDVIFFLVDEADRLRQLTAK